MQKERRIKYETDWFTYDNLSKIFWEVAVPKLIKANVIPENEFTFDRNITYKCFTDGSVNWENDDDDLPPDTSKRITLKILRDVFL